MRTRLPKVLHEVCGLPMVLWPVRAALAAGAESVVVVDSPERALAAVLPEGVELAVQERPNGTGGGGFAAMFPLASQAGARPPGGAPERGRPPRQRRGDTRAHPGARRERGRRHDAHHGAR